MKSLPAGVIAELQKARMSSALVWLLKIPVSESITLREYFAFTDHPTPITFPASGGTVFDPYPMAVGAVETDNNASIPSLEVTVSNVSRTVARYVAKADSPLGKKATLTLVNTANLSSAEAAIATISMRVAASRITRASATFPLELPGLHDLEFPRELYYRDRCGVRFGSPQCGFVITASSSTTCGGGVHGDKTLAACTARGGEEVLAGRPRLHPRMFGGRPGLPRGVRL